MIACRVCGRAVDDYGTCVCATFPAARPAPEPWSWITKDEAIVLRDALHALRAFGVEPGTPSYCAAPQLAGYTLQLADVVEALLVELPRRRPRVAEAKVAIDLFLAGARSRGADES